MKLIVYVEECIIKAQKMLDNAKRAHKDAKQNNVFSAYNTLCRQGVFDNQHIAEVLFSIQDDSYAYIEEFIQGNCDNKVLLNVFSGSGRLFRILNEQSKLDEFESVYSVDSSPSMIEFQKTISDFKRVSYVCQDVLHVGNGMLLYDIAICHCGVRYLDPADYASFLTIMESCKRGRESICVLTEVDERIVFRIVSILNQMGLAHKHKAMNMRLQRNTSLYMAINMYRVDKGFHELINEIAAYQNLNLEQVLIHVSGYKEVAMHILSF